MRQRPNTGRVIPINRRDAFCRGRSRNLRARREAARFGPGARREPDRGDPTASAGPLVAIIGDRHAIAAHAAEYDQLRDFIHDETTACERCCLRWYQAPPGGFDADIRAVEGVLVCEDCTEPHLIDAVADAVVEHGTWRAHSGGVVG